MGNAGLAQTGRFVGWASVAMVATLVAAALSPLGPAAAAAIPGHVASQAARESAAGVISTVAGGVGGPANAASVPVAPCDVAFAGGHLYIADSLKRSVGSLSGAVREMSPGSSLLTTPAGTHEAGPLGDGGPATAATLNSCGITADGSGNLVISDLLSSRIRVVAASTGTFYGQAMTAGDIYTVAGDGSHGFSGDGGPATSATIFPTGVAVDGAGNLVIADGRHDRVRETTG